MKEIETNNQEHNKMNLLFKMIIKVLIILAINHSAADPVKIYLKSLYEKR
jgi:hypothetical protein